MARTVAHGCALHEATPEELRGWQALAQADQAPLYPMRAAAGAARPLGADNGMLPMLIGS